MLRSRCRRCREGHLSRLGLRRAWRRRRHWRGRGCAGPGRAPAPAAARRRTASASASPPCPPCCQSWRSAVRSCRVYGRAGGSAVQRMGLVLACDHSRVQQGAAGCVMAGALLCREAAGRQFPAPLHSRAHTGGAMASQRRRPPTRRQAHTPKSSLAKLVRLGTHCSVPVQSRASALPLPLTKSTPDPSPPDEVDNPLLSGHLVHPQLLAQAADADGLLSGRAGGQRVERDRQGVSGIPEVGLRQPALPTLSYGRCRPAAQGSSYSSSSRSCELPLPAPLTLWDLCRGAG